MTTRARIGELEHDNHDSTFRLEPLGHGSKRQEIYGQGCRPGQLVQDSWDRTDVKVQPVWDRSTWKERGLLDRSTTLYFYKRLKTSLYKLRGNFLENLFYKNVHLKIIYNF
jgi:hypothetical protein